MTSLREPGLFAALGNARRVLVAGAGGGFDVYAGLPLALTLMNLGTTVHLANLTFSPLDHLDLDDWCAPDLARIGPDTPGHPQYFPERTLARWLRSQDLDPTVYALARTGVLPLRAAYGTLAELLDLDAIILVDGGTDILMEGDESGLGTPEEDMASLTAVAALDVATRLVVCVGFGIDAYHGVCHTHVLENIAALDRDGAYLGALSIPRDAPETLQYLDAVAHAQLHTSTHPSIVNGQIAAALRAEFGNAQFTDRTQGSDLFVNPLMAMYFSFDLDGLARRLRYRDLIENTRTTLDITRTIEAYRAGVTPRPRRTFPH